MKNIGRNIKFLRKQKKLTQQQLADSIEIKRSMLGAYEEERADPRMDTLLRFANFFGVTTDELIGEEIDNAWMKKKEDSGKGPSLRVLSITVDSQSRENIEFIPVKASAGYLNGYSDPMFIEKLPKFQLPMLQGGTYRAFELKGDSMLPLLPGTIVIGQYMDDWKNLASEETYIIISKNEGIVYKRVVNQLRENRSLLLKSDNPEYSPYFVPAEDILEIWKAKAYISLSFPGGSPDVSIEHLSSLVSDLQRTVKQLQNKVN